MKVAQKVKACIGISLVCGITAATVNQLWICTDEHAAEYTTAMTTVQHLTSSTYRPLPTAMPMPTAMPTPTATPTPIPSPTPDPVYLAGKDLLARLIYCEAGGEGKEAMMAVGQVVKNRMNYFKLSLSEAIYEPGVFTPVSTGWIDTVEPSDEAYDAAQALMDGAGCPMVASALWFCTLECYADTSGFHYQSSHGDSADMYEVGTIGTTVFFAPMSAGGSTYD